MSFSLSFVQRTAGGALALGALMLFLIGCGSTQRPVRVNYDTGSNETVYRALSITVPIESQGSGYGSQFNQLRMNLQAECQGRECTPASALMTLSTGGSSDLYLGNRTLTVTADDEEFVWEDPRGQRDLQPERVVGMVAQVSTSIDQLKAMATAEAVSGQIGSVILRLGGRTQDRVRAFLVRTGHLDAEAEPS